MPPSLRCHAEGVFSFMSYGWVIFETLKDGMHKGYVIFCKLQDSFGLDLLKMQNIIAFLH